MSNIIDSIQLSGVTYTLSAETSGGGITSGEVQTMIDESISGKVNVSDNEVSGLTVTNEITTNVNYNYGDISDFWIEDTSSWAGTSSFTFKSINSFSSTGNCTINYYHSSQIISSVSSSSGNFTYQIADGKLHITFNSGYSLYNATTNSSTYYYYLKSYQGGQSADVIEGSINDAINDTNKRIVENAVTNTNIFIADGSNSLTYAQYYKTSSKTNQFKLIDGKTIIYNNGLYVNFSGSTKHDVILNTGSGVYCSSPSVIIFPSYAYSYDTMKIEFNSGYTGSTTSYTLTFNIISSSDSVSYEAYTYNTTTNTLTASGQSYNSSVTMDGYNASFTIAEGYRFRQVSVSNCRIAGIDAADKRAYIITKVTVPSYNYNGQEMIDAINTELSGKQDTLSAGTGIQISGNVISATGSTGGGSPTVEVTQAEYDALVTAGTVSADTYYIITDAQAGDLTNYYTKTETNTLLNGKQATLVSGTNIKTINNESLLGSGNITIQGGGVDVVQTTGTSTTDVMSQDAVTTEINNKANKSAAYGSYAFGQTNNQPFIRYRSVSNQNLGNEIYYPNINGKGILANNKTWAQNNLNFQLVETSAITSAVTSASTDAQVPSAKCVYDTLGGLKLVKLTQSAYDALSPNYDSNTLYVIVN